LQIESWRYENQCLEASFYSREKPSHRCPPTVTLVGQFVGIDLLACLKVVDRPAEVLSPEYDVVSISTAGVRPVDRLRSASTFKSSLVDRE
jgi:hypothetical protein